MRIRMILRRIFSDQKRDGWQCVAWELICQWCCRLQSKETAVREKKKAGGGAGEG